MAANTVPLFPDTAIAAVGVVDTANATLTGAAGSVITIYTPGADGGRIDLIRVKAQVTTTAGMVRLFIHDGTNNRLWAEIPVSAIVPSATVESFEAELVPTRPLVLPSGYSLRATTEKSEAMNVFAHGGDF